MAGQKSKIEQETEARETIKNLCGEDVVSAVEDDFDGSKDEPKVFMNILYETGPDDPSRENLLLASSSSMKGSSELLFQNEKIGVSVKGISKFERLLENSSLGTGSDSQSMNAKRKKSSTVGFLYETGPDHPSRENLLLASSLPMKGPSELLFQNEKIGVSVKGISRFEGLLESSSLGAGSDSQNMNAKWKKSSTVGILYETSPDHPSRESLLLASSLSMEGSSELLFQNEMIGVSVKGISKFEGLLESSSLGARSDSQSMNAKRKKLSTAGILADKCKKPRYLLPDTGNHSQPNAPIVFTSEPMQKSLVVVHNVTFRIVESSRRGEISSNYRTNSDVLGGTESTDDDVVLDAQCTDQQVGDRKVAMEVKSATSPTSQESVASGILVKCMSTAPKETPRTLACINRTPKESTKPKSEVAVASKRELIRELPTRLQSQAHRLLMDAGWIIEPRKRSDRAKLACRFITPDGGDTFRALSQAWKLCGERLLANSMRSAQDENGREWMDIDVFWGDLTDTLLCIEKQSDHPEKSVDLLQRWQILDPFMAVVLIDKRIGTLREGKALRAVGSATYFLRERKNTVLADESVDQIEGPLSNSCLLDYSSQTIVPALESDCKSELHECRSTQQVPIIHGVQDLDTKHKNRSARQKRCYCGELRKRSVRSMARQIGKGLCNTKCFHCKASASKLNKKNRLLNKSTLMLEGSQHSYPVTSPADDFSPQGSVTPDPETLTFDSQNMNRTANSNIYGSPLIGEMVVGNELCLRTNISVENLVNNLTKKARKRSKKISEIQSTGLHGKGSIVMRGDRMCRDALHSRMVDRITHHLDLPFHQELGNAFKSESSPESLEHSDYLKEQSSKAVDAPKSGKAHASTVLEISSTTKKPAKSETKAARQSRKGKKSDLTMPLEDKPEGTLLTLDKIQEELTHHASTKRSSSNKSSSMNLSRQKLASKLDNVQPHSMDFKESAVMADDRNVPSESHCEGSNDILILDAAVSHSRSKKKTSKAKKLEGQMETGRKKALGGCRIDDDDLLIAAILKKKDFGSGRKCISSNIGVSQSQALRKLKSQNGSRKLLLRTTGRGGNQSMDGKRFITGARTVLCWLIDNGALSLKDTVQYRNPKGDAVVKDGWVTREGILCKCCTNLLSISDFKAHAGFKLNKPSLNLFLQSGKPYTLCQLQAWSSEYKTRKGRVRVMEVEEVDQNDDTCGICGDGGELICCDNCPSTYHQACLPSQELPEGSWYCSNCICQICKEVVGHKEPSSSLASLECSQCEHKYHDTCIMEKVTSNGGVGSGTWFCGESCQEVYLGLRSRVGVKNNIGEGFSWTILRCSNDDQKVHSAQKIAAMAECNTQLAIALTIMEECFLPMVDPRTGIDMIPQVLYNWGSNFARLNYQGFYTAVLEKDDKLISVASIRMHGVNVAEMPLIATCSEHRRQGMCRRLMNAIEKMLKSFKVKMLVLSAIPHLVDTWTSGFGFKPIEDDDMQQLKNVNLMLFPGTSMLKKNLCDDNAEGSGGNSHPCTGVVQSENLEAFDEGNFRTDLDTKSLLPITVNKCEMNQFSTEEAAVTKMSAVIQYCSDSHTPARNNESLSDPNSHRTLKIFGGMEENKSQSINVCREQSVVEVKNMNSLLKETPDLNEENLGELNNKE